MKESFLFKLAPTSGSLASRKLYYCLVDTPVRVGGKQNLGVKQLIQPSAALGFKAVPGQKPGEANCIVQCPAARNLLVQGSSFLLGSTASNNCYFLPKYPPEALPELNILPPTCDQGAA